MTTESPVVAQYEPDVHAVHADIPVDVARVPTRQGEQTVDEAAENLPAAHAPLTALSPVVAQYDPAVHLLQLEEDDDAA